MKKKYVILLMILCSTISFSQVKKEAVEVIVGAEKEIIPKIGDTINEYYSDNQTLKKKKFRNENTFTVKEYNENGNIYKSTDFPLENLKFKTLTKYNSSGNVILIANYDNGIVTGFFQKFHDNGNKKQVGNYDRMRKIGEWKYFDENGNLEKTERYENGKLVD